MTEMKQCSKCKEVKPVTEFNKKATAKDGLQWNCKTCHRAKSAEWYRNNPEVKRVTRLRYTYNITVADYETLLASQGGVCAICGTKPRNKRLAVDHDHHCCPGGRSCGKCIRGLLCVTCNRKVLGGAERTYKDKTRAIGILKKAIEYLERGPIGVPADNESDRTLRRAA